MAVFEQSRMTEGDQSTPVKQQPMKNEEEEGPFSPLQQRPSTSQRTPRLPPSASKKTEMMKTPSLTPATVAMTTPMSEISTPPVGVPQELCISSSSGGVDSTTSSSSDNTCPSLRHQARPSRDPSPSGRVLIFNDDSVEMQPDTLRSNSGSSRSLSRRGSASMLPPKQKDPCGYHGRPNNTNRPLSRKVRSRPRNFQRPSSFHESELREQDAGTPAVGLPRKSRSSRIHRSNSSDLSLSDYNNYSDNEEDDDQQQLYGNMFETESITSTASQSPNHHYKDNKYARRRRRSNNMRRTESSPEKNGGACKLPRFMSTTKCLVWLLCLVGLTSVSMIILTNHSLLAHDLVMREKQDPVAVLFSTPKKNKTKGKKVAQPKTSLRGATEKTHKSSGVNLNALAQTQTEAEKNNKKQQPAQEQPQHSKDKTHHKKEADTHHARKEEKKKKSQHQAAEHKDEKHHHDEDNKKKKQSKDAHQKDEKAAPKKKKEKKHHEEAKHDHHHHHHDHAEEVKRAYIREKPGIIGMSAIPLVALPPSIETVSSTGNFESVDRGLFTLYDNTTMDGPKNKRVVTLDGSPITGASPKPRLIIDDYPAEVTDNTQLYPVLDSSDQRVSKSMERRNPHVKEECVPMQEWQTTFHPSCNGMHEVDMPRMGDDHIEDDFKLFGMKGFWRNAWKFDSMGGHTALGERDTVVLKTLKINHRFEDAFYEHNRIDAVVLERLTASPHVINVFGFCGHSVVTEYADGKRLGELADKKKNEPLARLGIARDIANGLADVHGIDGDGNATFVHLDINPANVVSVGGTLKLNDFNIGILRRWNTTSNEPCGIPAQYPNPQWRSPEEARHEQNLTEKVDVFSMGHILFRLICEHEPWHKWEPNGMPPKDVLNERVKRGELPTIPDHVLKSTDPEVVAIRENMLRCYTNDVAKRPSAREIANSLQRALDELKTNAKVE